MATTGYNSNLCYQTRSCPKLGGTESSGVLLFFSASSVIKIMDRISSSFLLRVKHLVISLTSQLILRKELKQISATNYLMVTVVGRFHVVVVMAPVWGGLLAHIKLWNLKKFCPEWYFKANYGFYYYYHFEIMVSVMTMCHQLFVVEKYFSRCNLFIWTLHSWNCKFTVNFLQVESNSNIPCFI